jgi:DNA-binding response OmpR family regulator
MVNLFNILLIDDDPDIYNLLKKISPYYVNLIFVTNKNQLYQKVLQNSFDIIIFDLLLKKDNSLDIISELKSNGMLANSKILILTKNPSPSLEISGHYLDVSEYIIKPIRPDLYIAIIDKYYRASRHKLTNIEQANAKIIKCGILEINTELAEVQLNKEQIITKLILTSIEYKLLLCLISKQGLIVSRDVLYKAGWQKKLSASNRTLDMRISSIRKKLGVAGNYVQTVRSKGYRLIDGK